MGRVTQHRCESLQPTASATASVTDRRWQNLWGFKVVHKPPTARAARAARAATQHEVGDVNQVRYSVQIRMWLCVHSKQLLSLR